jgi:alpha-beta hydrolase superfamily lysophospholipase
MREEHFQLQDPEGIQLFTYAWHPDADTPVIGAVQIAHGMTETAARYKRFAKALTDAGFVVYANDHRGHGKTAADFKELGYIGENGFEWMVHNMKQVNEQIQANHAGLPIFLFGHSMGSFLTQWYMSLYGESISGAILSGSNGKVSSAIHMGILLAKREMKKKGPKALSEALTKLTFGSYNKPFHPVRTKFDWLSRDPEEVDRYINDPYCGGVFPASFYYYFFKGLLEIQKPQTQQRIPKTLPVLIVSGDKDPVGRFGKGVRQLYETYQALGLQDVTCKLYEGGRHEMLNEINRDEVTQDLLRWLKQHI